ncbi:hypothetical protein SLS64_003633 [Diaporthe eres]
MMYVGYAELASAVSNAGGLGIITALIFPTPADLRKEIQKCRSLTKNPFGVNITLLPSLNPPDYGAYAQAIIDEGINIVETAGNSPGPVIRKLKEAGCIVLHKCSESALLPPIQAGLTLSLSLCAYDRRLHGDTLHSHY